MADAYVSTHWHVHEGQEQAFVDLWRSALTWTKEAFAEGLEHARLLSDDEDPRHFVSFIEWADREWIDRWQADPGYAERLAALDALCREADGTSYSEATRVA